jgi:hypothetical protein
MAKTQLQVAMFPSTVGIIRQVIVKKTYTARNIGIEAFLFIFYHYHFSYVCDAKLLIPYFSL